MSNSMHSFSSLRTCGKIFLFLLFLLSSNIVWGQGELPTSEVEVVKRFEARLEESEKLKIEPGNVTVDPLPLDYEYQVLDHTEQVSYDPVEIKPRGYRIEKGPEVYSGFLKAGAGWPLNYLGQAGYRFDIDRSKQANIFADIRGLNDGKIENREVMNIHLNGDYSFYTTNGVKISAFAGYRKDNYKYYNPPEEVDSTVANKVNYNDIHIGTSLRNYQKNNFGIDYQLDIDGKFLNTNYAQKNNTFNIAGKAEKSFGEHWFLNIGLGSYNDTYTDGEKSKQNYFVFNPTLKYATGRLQIKGGILLLSSGSDVSLKPDAEVEVGILPNQLHAFVGADGRYKINSIRSFISENPFLAHEIDSLKITNIDHYYGGVKGNFYGINYNLQGGYRMMKDLAVFQLNYPADPFTDGYLLYQPVFDDATNIYGELSVSMPLLDHLNIYTLVRYDHYTMDVLEKPFYIPSTKVQLGAKYSMMNGRLNLGMDFNFLTAVDYPENELKKPNAVFDINLNGEYLFTDQFGAFLQLNNLADSHYIRWQNYESLGLNVLAGISMRFR